MAQPTNAMTRTLRASASGPIRMPGPNRALVHGFSLLDGLIHRKPASRRTSHKRHSDITPTPAKPTIATPLPAVHTKTNPATTPTKATDAVAKCFQSSRWGHTARHSMAGVSASGFAGRSFTEAGTVPPTPSMGPNCRPIACATSSSEAAAGQVLMPHHTAVGSRSQAGNHALTRTAR